jgi:hypothetical protein
MVTKSPRAARGDSYADSQLTAFATDPQRELAEPAADYEAAQMCATAQGDAYLIENRVDDAVVRPSQSKP